MKTLRISLSLLLFSSLALPTSLRAEDLIPPTRSLESSEKPMGRLTVVSEPPDLEVFLDGSEIGRTPVWLKYVKPGVHNLRVGNLQVDVYVESGKRKTLSFYHGSFIKVPEEREAQEKTGPESEKTPDGKRGIKAPAEETERDLTPWERFLNRTAPSF